MSREINFDLARMKRAVAGPFRTLPEGITRDQLREWMLSDAKAVAAAKQRAEGAD